MKKNFILVLAMMIIPTIIFSQIMYNVSKPFSYDKSGLKNISELPQIHFPVNNEGNLIEQNLKLNIKEKAVNEIIDNKFVTRMKVKVFAEKLGMMTLILDNVKLNNNSYCYVYTPDYKIVAGPIYQGSIDKYLIIKEIPTDELIIEVISNFASDFDLSIDEVDYFTKFKDKDKSENQTQERLLSDSLRDYACSYGDVKYFENTQLITAYKCGEYGFPNDYDQFQTNYMRGVNDFQFAASRASCVVYKPIYLGNKEYPNRNHEGENGTLINFPYDDCDVNECGEGIVVGMYHNGFAGAMVNATPDFKNRVLIRFNLHHKYGTPWHLQNVNCIADSNNFKKWRETIDFSEVIDYCGVSMFLYDVDGRGADIFMIKMNQKPFYKEHHIGWTSQNFFANQKNIYAIGRHGTGPTLIFYNNDKTNQCSTSIKIDKLNILYAKGISGSNCIADNDLNISDFISFGLIAKSANGDKNYTSITTNIFSDIFNDFDSIKFYSNSSCPINFTKIDTYLRQTKFNGIVNKNLNPNYLWMPSKDNKQKCPSTQGKISGNNYLPCNFDIANYINWNDSTKCFTIDSIPANLFPKGILPKGYRIYHNFGDQKTIKFEPFIDNTNIEFPINACVDNCDILYLMTIGRENIDIAIDFYDADGRVLNNPGCDSMKYSINLPFSLCDIFNIDNILVEKVSDVSSECCEYKFTFNLPECDNEQILKMILENLKFNGTRITKINGVEINYDSGFVTFNIIVCSNDYPLTYNFTYSDKYNDCINTPKEYPLCNCLCSINNYKWFTLTLTPGGEGTNCTEDQCAVSGTINIPEFFNCPGNAFTHYSISPYHFLKHELPLDGIIPEYQTSSIGCLNKGEARYDDIKLYRGIADTLPPCPISRLIYCKLEDKTNPCTPDCDTVEWKTYRFKEWLPLPDCPDCKVIADYVARKNPCTGMQEIQIVKFETWSFDNNKTACENCNISIDDIYKIVLKKAIYDNQMGFQPSLEENETEKCDSTWRVVQGACWVSYTDYLFQPEGGKVVYKPCDSVECCSVGLRVCRYYMGEGNPEKVTIETLGGTNPSNCIGFTQPVFDPQGLQNPIYHTDGWVSYNTTITLPCQSRCNWLYGLADSAIYGKQSINYENDTKYSKDYNGIGIKIDINDDYLALNVNSDFSNKDIKISIYSLQGQKLLTNGYSVSKGINHFKLYTQDFMSGIYFISLQVDELILRTEKLIIIK